MSNYIFDTSILIGYLRKNENCISLLTEISEEQDLLISPITRLEIIVGIKKEEINRTYYLLNEICRTIKFTDSTFEIAENILLELRNKNLFIEIPDAIIAACAIENNLSLITSNRKHFENIRDLKLSLHKF